MSPHLSVQQVEVVHGLLHPTLASDLRSATLRTKQLVHTSLFNGRREKRLKTRLTQEAGAVSHGDDLQDGEEDGRHDWTVVLRGHTQVTHLAEGHLVLTDGAAVSQEPEGG